MSTYESYTIDDYRSLWRNSALGKELGLNAKVSSRNEKQITPKFRGIEYWKRKWNMTTKPKKKWQFSETTKEFHKDMKENWNKTNSHDVNFFSKFLDMTWKVDRRYKKGGYWIDGNGVRYKHLNEV